MLSKNGIMWDFFPKGQHTSIMLIIMLITILIIVLIIMLIIPPWFPPKQRRGGNIGARSPLTLAPCARADDEDVDDHHHPDDVDHQGHHVDHQDDLAGLAGEHEAILLRGALLPPDISPIIIMITSTWTMIDIGGVF